MRSCQSLLALSVAIGCCAPQMFGQEWTETTPLPEACIGHKLLASGIHLYHTGGIWDVSGILGGHRVFYASIAGDGTLGSWIEGESLPEAVFHHAAVVSNDTLFVLGGLHWDGKAINISDKSYFSRLNLDASPGVWQETTSLPLIADFLGAAVWNGRMYIVGGFGGDDCTYSSVFSTLIGANGSLGPWTVEASLPTELYLHASFAIANTLYVIGGSVNCGTVATDQVWYATINGDGSLNEWSPTAQLPVPLTSMGAAATCGRTYLAGGDTGTIISAQSFWADAMPDHSLRAWSALPSLPQPRYSHGMASTDRFAFVSGGFDAASLPQLSVWVMPLPADATAPAITQQPSRQTIGAGEAATFTVSATGAAPLSYQWRKGGADLVDGGAISGATTQALTIDSVQAADAGVYDVLVSNGCGLALSDAVELIVIVPCPADIVSGETFAPPPDGSVDAADLAFLLGDWGRAKDSPGDMVTAATFAPPPDGFVDAADLAFLLGDWGECE